MRLWLVVPFVFASGLTALAVQTSSPSSPAQAPSKTATKLSTLIGCISETGATEAQSTFVDAKGGTTYRLTGHDMREYAGRRVQIVGQTNPRRLHVAGGLLPNPNVAAQAGSIDPGQAAIATANQGVGTAPASGTPSTEFRVRSVRPVTGSCPHP